ncbi:hypothetical protein GCM10025862_10190 [Arsenicicoccus piscis]|uniref:Uncharacterized protein n=1 Tax=Arsenicicoccus piscis TaxID=673954 RepID=A0ABQ6HMU5_9MICO|nr:hypothetical protein GCM10025862_10190 [Arsenicicoccus piscis]
MLVEQADQLAADLTGQHHPHDVHHLGRRDPQPALELAVQVQAREHRRDLRAAAVHDDRTQPGVAQENDVLGERRLERIVGHGFAAVLDDHEGAAELLEPGQRLDQDRGLRQRLGVRLQQAGPGRGLGRLDRLRLGGLDRLGLGIAHVL